MIPKYKKLIIHNVEEYKTDLLNKYYMVINKIQNRPRLNNEDTIRLARLGFNFNNQYISNQLTNEFFQPMNINKSNILLSISKKYIRKTYTCINTHFLNEVFMYTLLIKYGISDLAPKLIDIRYQPPYFTITLEYIPNEYMPGNFTLYDLNTLIINISKIHALGIIHGDIKPDNLVLPNNKPVKIIDFEYCKVMYPFIEQNLRSMNHYTPLYTPLDRLQAPAYIDYKISYNDDVWAIGITLLEAYIGIEIFGKCYNISQLKKSITTQITSDNIKNEMIPDNEKFSTLIILMLIERVSITDIINYLIHLEYH
jgi:serine/threonine protein kinase